MDFDFSPELVVFAEEVEKFLDEHDDPEIFDLTRENMAQIVDTPKRRALHEEDRASKGWLGITWPKEWGGQEGEGVYEYILNEALAGRGGPQIGKGVGIIGKTILAHGTEKLKKEFLPKILANEVEFAVGYSEPDAGSDAASMKLKATQGRRRLAAQRPEGWTTSAHFAEWYWVGARTDPDVKHHGHHAVPRPDGPPRHHGQRDRHWTPWATSAPTRSSSTTSSCPTTTSSASVNKGFQYISQALDLERFTMFTFSPDRAAPRPARRLRAARPPSTTSRSRTTRWCASASPSSSPRPRSPGCSGSRSWRPR